MSDQFLSADEANRLGALLDESKHIIVTCHVSPDGDAMGAVLAFSHYLWRKGKDAVPVVPNIFPDFLKWMPGADQVRVYEKHEAEVCAALGCQVMVCHLPNLRPYVDAARDVDVVGRVAELTRRNGVRLAVETCFYPGPAGETLPDAELVIQVVESLDLPDVGINVDTGHCLLGQTNACPEGVRRLLEEGEPQTLPDLIRRIGRRLFTTVGSPGVKYTSPGQKLHLKAGGNQRVTSCWSR